MKIRFILSHPAARLYGEVREAMIARALIGLGHDVEIHRIQRGAEVKRERYADAVPVSYFPADDPAALPHRTLSAPLLEALVAAAPDIVILKGIGYDIVEAVLDRLAGQVVRFGCILGGLAVHPVLQRLDFVLAESEGQVDAIAQASGRPLPSRILAKYIDWPLADRLHAERAAGAPPLHDIVNVGSFEPRKNQIALRDFFGRHRVAMIGDGETLAAVAGAAKGHSDVKLYGALPNAETLRVVSRSRLMVHASLWEGVPRAMLEALACGTPVVAHGFAVQERFEGTRATRLVADGGLVQATEELLADPALLAAMGEEGRAFARARHGPQRLAEAADHILAMAEGRT